MTGALSPSHWVIILVVVLLLFGAKRLPDAARGLGKSLRIFKAETSALSDGGEKTPEGAEKTAGTPAEPTAATPTTTTAATTTAATPATEDVAGTGPELVRPAPPARDTAA